MLSTIRKSWKLSKRWKRKMILFSVDLKRKTQALKELIPLEQYYRLGG
jgi:hypothetical protein